MEVRFFKCMHCGNIVTFMKSSGVPVMCCGEKMQELIPGTSDGAVEKHVPVYTVEAGKVCVSVGSVDHPMVEAHFIEWVAVQTNKGVHFVELKPGTEPKACVSLCDDETVEAVFAYCNLHGLWKA